MADSDKPSMEKPSMEEKLNKATDILLDQFRTNMKPTESLEQAQALHCMAEARQMLLSEDQVIGKGKDTPKK